MARYQQTFYRRPKAGAFARVVAIYDPVSLNISELFLEEEGLSARYFRLNIRPTGKAVISRTKRGGRLDIPVTGLKMETVPDRLGGPDIPHLPFTVRTSTRPLGV